MNMTAKAVFLLIKMKVKIMSTRQNTNNERPSNALADLNDNTIIIDEFVNSKQSHTTDRFGNEMDTLHQIVNRSNKVIGDYTNKLQSIENGERYLPKTGGSINGTIISEQPKTYDIVASNDWIRSLSHTFPKANLAHGNGGGGFAIVSGADDANLGNTSNLTFASWNGVGFAPMHTPNAEDTVINNTVVINCRNGTVIALNGFYEQGKKLIKQDEYGVGHQNLSLTKISDNLNEQNASFFGSTYANMPESIKPYINNGAGIVGITLPYRATSEGWKASSRFFTEVGGTPSKIFYQECHQGTWQKPSQLITDENIKSHIGSAHIIETYKSEDGSSWYRKWNDGFIEQGIVKTGTFNMSTVHNLIKPFSNANYTIILNALFNNDNFSVPVSAREKTLTSFTSEAFRGAGGNVTYTTLTIYACGY